MMIKEKVVLVKCVFLRGAFPHERVFVIRLGDDWEYRGVAPAAYCFDRDGQPFVDSSMGESEVEGMLIGIQIASGADGVARVQLPDGELYDLPEDRLVIPSRVGSGVNVPVKS